jgi:transcriptional regulator with XRE-family HTH domain
MNSPEQPASDIGEAIKRRREEANLSLSGLATRANVSKGYLWNLESRKSEARPSGQTLYRIAEALGTTMSDLLGQQLLVDTVAVKDMPPGLAELVQAENLTERDVQMLSAINFRGQHPRDLTGWMLVWTAIKSASSRK